MEGEQTILIVARAAMYCAWIRLVASRIEKLPKNSRPKEASSMTRSPLEVVIQGGTARLALSRLAAPTKVHTTLRGLVSSSLAY